MSGKERTNVSTEYGEDRCDTRVWSGDCTHDEKYLCVSCGKIPGLNHEVRHEIFPHIKGDTDSLY